MTVIQETVPENVVAAQWRVLGKLIQEPKDVHTLNARLFHGTRRDLYNYIKGAYVADGLVTLEGVQATFGRIPPQLEVAGTSNIRPLVRVLADYASREMLFNLGTELKRIAREPTLDMQAAKNKLKIEPLNVVEDSTIEAGADQYLSTLRSKRKKAYKFCRTGLKFLDNKIGGEWRPSTAHIVLGAPGSGKTAFVLNSMYRMAKQSASTGKTVDLTTTDTTTGEIIDDITASLFISLEMKKEDLFARLLADITEINYKLILEGDRLSDEQVDLISEATERIRKLPIYIVDRATMPLDEIIFNIKWHVDTFGVRVIFLDYLQIVNYNTGNRIYDLGHIMQALKDLASTLGITVVVLSQVTESNEGIERIRDSRIPGQIADVVFELVMEDASNNDPQRAGNLALYKNRFGPLGMSPILFYGIYQRFENGV